MLEQGSATYGTRAESVAATSAGLWALQQIIPQIRKLRTQDFDLWLCEPISYRKHLR